MSDRLFPLSYPQRMFWFLHRLEPNTPAYNLPRAFKITGRLDADALLEAFGVLLRRHDILRTYFVESDGELYQGVRDDVRTQLALFDLSSLPVSRHEIAVQTIAGQEAQKPFDLEQPPLFRVKLVRLGPEQHVLILVMHHIITDGWSMSILFRQIAEFYERLVRGEQPQISQLPLQYADFAHWQQQALTEEVLQGDVEYWRQRLHGSPPLLQLPSDRPRPDGQGHLGSIESFVIDKRLTGQVKQMCMGEGVTLFMGLLSAFQALLCRYTASDDIPVGTPVATRNDPGLADLIGCFVNTLVLRGDFSGDPSFREALQRTRTAVLGGLAHQELPFELLLAKLQTERTRNYTPVFQVMFVLHNEPKQVVRLPGLLLEEVEIDSGLAKFDLTLEIVEQDGSLYCQFEYNSDLFERSSIQRMAGHLQELIAGAIENRDLPISRLNLLPALERKQITLDWNETAAEYSKILTLAKAFEDQLRRTPDATALRDSARTLTYRQLDRCSNRVARALIDKGIRSGMPVGIYMRRSIDAIVALLAVTKIGSPFVPLEPSHPKHRIKLMLDTCDCRIVVTDPALSAHLPEVDSIALDEALLRALDEDLLRTADASVMFPHQPATDHPAYMIFTSGSTGVPKAVAGTHLATMNRLEWMYRAYPFSPSEVCCQKTALSFVDSIWEIFGPLLRGIPNVVLPEEVVIDPDRLLASLAQEQVTRIVLVPTLLRLLLDHAPNLAARVPRLKLWTVSGEYLTVDLAERFRTAFPEARLLNLYGSSEVAGDATYYEIGALAGFTTIPIGKPISNTRLYVLDEFLQPVPIGVPGTLYVAGDGLAQGYWRQPDLTSECFLPNPFEGGRGRIFATGDRARWLSDGNLEYLGRLDTQIKLRGVRVELGEIEATLQAHPLIRQAIVAVTGRLPEAAQLTAYILGLDGATPSPQELRDFLRARLPLAMIPVSFVEMVALPLLPSGKVDRRALPEPPISAPPTGQLPIAPRNEIERQLAAIWRELLDVNAFGVADNFFDLGGNSLLAMQVLARIRRTFQVEVSVRSLFDGPSIEALGRAIEEAKASGAVPRVPPIVARPRPAAGLDALSAELRDLSPEQIEMLLRQVRQEKNVQ